MRRALSAAIDALGSAAPLALNAAFTAGWDAAKRDENAADDEDIADAADVAFYEWLRRVE